ncbi:MAG TPA: glycine cleavage T C-terminal barrel domain-containing protein [Verrucomicrobiae bacterium]|nr:glycine cleavage T C-terminal barrel domain-containing protein [Verrucomicrobiae bacterium]
MVSLVLHELHQRNGGRFAVLNQTEVVADYGDIAAEHMALTQHAGVLDLSFRGRLCVTGGDRARFLHGQVTNDVKALKTGEGCYAALITAKGKMQSDLFIHCLEQELLLDFEPGLSPGISERLEKYIIADDAQLVDVGSAYGLISVQGPGAAEVIESLKPGFSIPARSYQSTRIDDAELGEIYLTKHPRLSTSGFDLFAPVAALGAMFEKLDAAAKRMGGRACGWSAFEIARIEAGIPRFGQDMDETNLPLEAGLERSAISFQKGCYIGQEVISRVHTFGQVAKALRVLEFSEAPSVLPAKGEKLFSGEKEVGYVTSATGSLARPGKCVGLGYARKEVNQPGTELRLRDGTLAARIAALPARI